MAKYDIYGDGTIIDVSYQDFLGFLAQFTEACVSLAKSYIVNHASGLADFNNEYFKSNVERVNKKYLIASEGIDDKALNLENGTWSNCWQRDIAIG
jgi:hypothetical protein